MLVGNILAVSWPRLEDRPALRRRRFVPLHLPQEFPVDLDEYEKAETLGINVRLWDFLFYAVVGLW